MLEYRSTQSVLHTRTIDFTLQEYLFVVQVVMGEDLSTAYASVFDEKEFKKNVPSENEEEYLSQFAHKAELALEQQSCKHLREYLEQEYQSELQSRASTLQNYKFTGEDVQQLLANLLHNRVADSLDDASVKDVLSLIKSMYDSGALDSGDAFEKHFITIPKKYDALCPSCNHELYAVEGIDIVCPHCSQVFKWSETENRFYPEFSHL